MAGCSAQVPEVQCQPLAGSPCTGAGELSPELTHSGLDASGDALLCQFKCNFSVQCCFLTVFLWVFIQSKGIWNKCSNT